MAYDEELYQEKGSYGCGKIANDFEKKRVGRAVTHPKGKTEDCERISVFEFKKQGCFRGLTSQSKFSVTLTYNLKEKNIQDVIPLTYTPCHFGGIRWWFLCPSCKRRVGLLYKPYHKDYFRCRHCYDLTYLTRRIRGNFLEPFCRVVDLERKFLKLIEGKGQKGYSKQEIIQREKLTNKLLQFSQSMNRMKQQGEKQVSV